MTDRCFLSICIMTYNRAELLVATLDSITANDPPADVEVIISDNHSDDGTDQIMEAYIRNSRLKISYFKNDSNHGIDGNFLRSIERSGGKYTWMFSDDDIMPPGLLDYVLVYLRKEEFSLVYLAHYSFKNNDDPSRVYRDLWPKEDIPFDDSLAFLRMAGFGFISTLVFNTRLAQKNLGYPRALYNNAHIELALKVVFQEGGKFLFIGKRAVAARIPDTWGRNAFLKNSFINTSIVYSNAVAAGLIPLAYLDEIQRKWIYDDIPKFIVGAAKDGLLDEISPRKKELKDVFRKAAHKRLIGFYFFLVTSKLFLSMYRTFHRFYISRRLEKLNKK